MHLFLLWQVPTTDFFKKIEKWKILLKLPYGSVYHKVRTRVCGEHVFIFRNEGSQSPRMKRSQSPEMKGSLSSEMHGFCIQFRGSIFYSSLLCREIFNPAYQASKSSFSNSLQCAISVAKHNFKHMRWLFIYNYLSSQFFLFSTKITMQV